MIDSLVFLLEKYNLARSRVKTTRITLTHNIRRIIGNVIMILKHLEKLPKEKRLNFYVINSVSMHDLNCIS